VLREWVIGDHTRVERYAGYWRDWSKNPNPLDVVIAQKIPEEATLRQIMEKGGAFHMSPYRSVDYFKALENSPNVQLIRSGKPFSTLYLHINTTKPPLDDVHVRRALSYCFDYDQYVNNIRAGLGDQKCVGPLPRAFWGHNDDITPYTLDLDKAKAELGQSKYTPTQLSKMPITYYYIEPIEFERQAGLLLAGNGQEAGLNMAMNTIPWMKYGDAATKAETTPDIVSVGNTAPYADPDGLLYPLFHSTDSHTWAVNPTWWSDPKVDDLLDKARSITDQNQRADMYKEVQRIVNDAAPAIFAAEQASIAAADKHIRGIVYNWEYTFYPQWRFYWQ
jgi:peptide/nickel transport system substrate-binding protein